MTNRFTIREETSADRAHIAAVTDAAFDQPAESRLIDELRAAKAVVLSLVAEQGAILIGHILFSRVWVESGGRRAAAVALAPMAVVPDRQGQGIGSALVHAGLARLREQGETLVLVLGHSHYYPRFGFSADLARRFTCPWSGPNYMALALSNDAPGSGRVIYPPPFHKL